MTLAAAPSRITRSADHRYTFEGITYPGVTSILDVLDKSGPLMHWAAKQTATAAVRLLDELPAMLSNVGEAGVIQALTARGNWQRDSAAQLGTEVHDLADKYVKGETLPPMGDTQAARVKWYAEWWEGQLRDGAKLRLSEAFVLRPNTDHPEQGWGGTFDLLYFDADGATVLADIKTGGKWGRKVYESEVLQIAAYGLSNLVQPVTDGITEARTYPLPHIDKYKVIHVTAEGCKAIPVDITVREHMAFLDCLDLYHWTRSLKGKTA